MKTPNKQAKHAKYINQQTSNQISLLVRPMCSNIGHVDKTKHLLVQSNAKIQKALVCTQKNIKKNSTS